MMTMTKKILPLILLLALASGCMTSTPPSKATAPPQKKPAITQALHQRNYDVGRSSVEIFPLNTPQQEISSYQSIEHDSETTNENLSSFEQKKIQRRPARSLVLTSFTGKWQIKTKGNSCSLLLSSIPKIDLYNAGSKNCKKKALKRITAWDLKGNEIHIFQIGGALVALFTLDSENSSQALSGTLIESKEKIEISR